MKLRIVSGDRVELILSVSSNGRFYKQSNLRFAFLASYHITTNRPKINSLTMFSTFYSFFGLGWFLFCQGWGVKENSHQIHSKRLVSIHFLNQIESKWKSIFWSIRSLFWSQNWLHISFLLLNLRSSFKIVLWSVNCGTILLKILSRGKIFVKNGLVTCRFQVSKICKQSPSYQTNFGIKSIFKDTWHQRIVVVFVMELLSLQVQLCFSFLFYSPSHWQILWLISTTQ